MAQGLQSVWGCAQAGEIALESMADLALMQYPPPMVLRMPARRRAWVRMGDWATGVGQTVARLPVISRETCIVH